MEYKVLEDNELELIENVLYEDNMIFNRVFLKNFIKNENAYGFVAKDEGNIIGFAYGYSLLRPDGRTMFYVHSIGILSAYQDKGYGTGLLSYIKDYSMEIGCSEMFIITDKGNSRACHVYEKLGGRNDYEEEVVYVFDYKKGDYVWTAIRDIQIN